MSTTPINEIIPYKQYVAAAGATEFSGNWWIGAATDVILYKNGVEVTTGFTVTGLQDPTGFLVTFATAMVGGEVITLAGDFDIQRLTGYISGGSFRAESLNLELSTHIAVMLQLQRNIERKLGLKITSTLNPANFVVSDPEADKVLAWDGTSGALKNGPSIAQIANAQVYAEQAQEAADSIGAATGTFTVTATNTSTLQSLASRFSQNGKVINVRDMGAVGDGTTDDRAAIQSALDKGGQTHPVTVYIPAGRYKIGTDTTVGVEDWLSIPSNTTVIIEGELLHYINSVRGCLIGTKNLVLSNTGTQYSDVHIIFQGNGGITYPARTTSTERGAITMGHVDNFSITGCRVLGDDHGTWNVRIMHSNFGRITNKYINAGNGVGEDGIHIIGNCNTITVDGCIVYVGDDAMPLTQETTACNNCTIQNITISNCVFFTTNHSGFKALADTSVLNSTIKNVTISNCIFGIDTDTPPGGLIATMYNYTPANGNVIENIKFTNCIVTGKNGTGSTGLAADNLINMVNCDDVTISNFTVRDIYARVFDLQGCKRVTLGPNVRIEGWLGNTTVLSGLTVTDVTYQSSRIMRVQFAGTPDLSGVTTSGIRSFVTISGCANSINNGRFMITAVSTGSYYVDVDTVYSRAAGTDETGLTASASIIKRTGDSAIHVSGCPDFKLIDSYIDDPCRSAIRFEGDPSPRALVSGNEFRNCNADSIILLGTNKYAKVENNRAVNCYANEFINEVNSSNCEYNSFFNNQDIGDTSTCRQSFILTRSSSNRRNNRGSNSDVLVGTTSIISGTTSITVDISNYAKLITTDITAKDVMVTPTASLGSAKYFWVTVNGAARTMTINVDTNPAADVSFTYRIEPSN